MQDMDEYLVPKAPLTVGSILRAHSDAAYITHGQTVVGSKHCLESRRPNSFTVERAVFKRRGLAYCNIQRNESMRPLCLGSYGHRKYLLNPRKVRWRLP